MLPHLSTCKSPQQMFGALAKTYYAQKPELTRRMWSAYPSCPARPKVRVPASRNEGQRLSGCGLCFDHQELARMILPGGNRLSSLPGRGLRRSPGHFHRRGLILGLPAGMEAALRTAYEIATGKELADINFHDVRGLKGIKEAEVDLDGTTIKVAVAHGLRNARELMELVKSGQAQYHFIEIMLPRRLHWRRRAAHSHRHGDSGQENQGIYAG